MTEPTNDPPLVVRVEPTTATVPPSQRKRASIALLEAGAWATLFIVTQLFAAVVTFFVVFILYAVTAPNSKQFVDEQLDGFTAAVKPKGEGERPQMPSAIGESLAYGMLSAQFASVVLIAIVLPRRIGRGWTRQLGVSRPHWLHVVLVLLILPGFMIGADAIQSLFLAVTGIKPPETAKALNSVFKTFPWPLTVLAVAIGPGIVEELWCRGLIGRVLAPRIGLRAGVFVTALLFAAMHLDYTQFVVFTLMGLYLHFVYLATRSIWVPVILHAGNNALAIMIALTLPPEAIDRPMPLVVPLSAFSLLLFGTVALWTSRAIEVPILKEDEAWHERDGWLPEYPGVSAPPPEVNLRLGYATVSPAALIFTFVAFVAVIYLSYHFLI